MKSKEILIKDFLDKKAETNNTIDLNSYAIGMSDMHFAMESEIEQKDKEIACLNETIDFYIRTEKEATILHNEEIAELKALLTKGQVFDRSQLNPEFLKSIDSIERNMNKK